MLYIFISISHILDDTYDVTSGEILSTGQISVFVVGVNVPYAKHTSQYIIPTIDHPARNPDATVIQETNVDQVREYGYTRDI
jgi:hypothetical protein